MSTHCLNCGYQAALETGPCPECGTALTPRFFETASGKRWLKALAAADRAGRTARFCTLFAVLSLLAMMAMGALMGLLAPRGQAVSLLFSMFFLVVPIAMMATGTIGFCAFHWCLFKVAVPLASDADGRAALAAWARWSAVAGAVMMAALSVLNMFKPSIIGPPMALLEGSAALVCGAEVLLGAYLAVARGRAVVSENAQNQLWKRSPTRLVWINTIAGVAISVSFLVFRGYAPGTLTIYWLGWLLSAWTLSRSAESIRKRAKFAANAESATKFPHGPSAGELTVSSPQPSSPPS